MEFIGRVYFLYHKLFAVDFIPQLKTAVHRFVMETNLPSRIKDVKKEHVELVMNNMDNLMKRTHTTE